MSQRDRPAEGGAVANPRPAEPPASYPHAMGGPPARAPLPSWEAYFPSLDPAGQQHLLELTAAQGFVFADQLPIPPAIRVDSFPNVLQRIFTKHDLAATSFVEPIEPLDSALDGPQRDAVARSLQTPDLLLIQGLPGTGKTRLIAEIIGQSLARGRRVLVTAPSSAAVDAVLARLAAPASSAAIRCIGRDEKIEALPAHSRALTWQVQEQSRRRAWLQQAAEREQHDERELLRTRQEMSNWEQLEQLARERKEHTECADLLRGRHEAVSNEVRQEAENVVQPDNGGERPSRLKDALRLVEDAYAERLARIESERVELEKRRAEHGEQHDRAQQLREALRPLEDASGSGRFWSMNFWKAKLNKTLHEQLAEAEASLASSDDVLRSLIERDAALQQERADAENDWRRQRAGLIDAEVEIRLAEVNQRLTALEGLMAASDERFRELSVAAGAPFVAPAVADVQRAREQVAKQVSDLEQRHHQARCWREFVENNWETIARRMRSAVSLVAGPLSAISDSWFSEQAEGKKELFDLLIVDEAHLLLERDILPATRLARRWILVGEPAQPPPALTRSRPAGSGRKLLRPVPDLFARLWDHLHHETWTNEGDRLCCRLHPVAPADRRQLEKETVADRTDIELRILNPGAGPSILAEVLFPPSMCLADAKEYLFRELGEIPCLSRIRTAQWLETPDGIAFRLTPHPSGPYPPRLIALGAGIAMRTHDASPCLNNSEIAVIFNEPEGWDRRRAEEWIDRHLLTRDSGRACRLEINYRQSPALGAWLNEAAFSGFRHPAAEQRADGGVQFEPVPRRAPAGGQRRGGAGFEIDLGDPGQRELLPAHLAGRLPAQGCVNLPEAQGVVELLARLPSDGKTVVTATYPAQVALLRLLCPDHVRVADASELHQSECDVLIVSLTRSHVSRAVTYGDEPATMLQLLSRPRCRLILAGDPGTLARRAQWEGAIDHLDETAGERERRWVNAALRLVPVRPSQHSRVPEGVRV